MKIGDRVHLLDGVDRGVIISIDSKGVKVEWEETGFENLHEPFELVVVNRDIARWMNEPIIPKDNIPKKKSKERIKKRVIKEVDLHAGAILHSTKGMQSHEILSFQLNELSKAFENTYKSRIKTLIVIHGKGKGRLKEEVHNYLKAKSGIEFFDASWKEYGGGATEVNFLNY
jgi:dsDNA-specific endonuclease/ATPase MutS2